MGRVHGENYPLPPLRQALGSAVGAVQMGGLAFLFFGNTLFRLLGMAEPPAWYGQLMDNKMMLFGGYMALNMVHSQLVSSGAFEIYYNGALVFSKLEAGRMPNMRDLAAVLEGTYELRAVSAPFAGGAQ